jgi:hypothetical protein
VSKKGVVVSCSMLTAAELDRLGMERLNTEVAKDDVQDNVRPNYSIYMFDPAAQTFLIVAAAPPEMTNVHPVAIQAKTEPNATLPTNLDASLAAQGLGLIEVRSVYDTDELGRMSAGMLTAADAAPGCTTQIAMTAPSDAADTRAQVADLVKMKDPTNPAYGCAPVRFLSVVRAIAPGAGMTGMRQAIGETEFEMQQKLGYARVEPDGSAKFYVPANTPFALAPSVRTARQSIRTPTGSRCAPASAARATAATARAASVRSTRARWSTRRRPASRRRCPPPTRRARRWPVHGRVSTRPR